MNLNRRLRMKLVVGSVFGWMISSSAALANVVGTDAQNFNPITNGLDFVTVDSSETLKPGIFNFGLFFNYAVNSLPYYDSNPQNRTDFKDTLTSMDLNMGVGLMKNWDVGLSLPQLLRQNVTDNTGATRGEFSQSGNTEVRVNTKYRMSGDDSGGTALIGSVNFNRIKNNPYTGEDAGPTYNLEFAADTTWDKIATGFNVGHRWRSPGRAIANAPVAPFGNQFIASVAASYLFTDIDTKLIGEIFGSLPAKSENTARDRSQSSLELLLGIKHDITSQIAFHFGAGTELMQGAGSPDWRVYTGLNWALGPLWSESQGLEPAPLEEPAQVAESNTAVEPEQDRFVARNINFDFGSDRVSDSARPILAELAEYLRKPPAFSSVVIEGHTDSVGRDSYNLDLSQRRAQSIKEALVKDFGFAASKIQAVGFGESVPIADNGNFQGRALNRRVEFKINR